MNRSRYSMHVGLVVGLVASSALMEGCQSKLTSTVTIQGTHFQPSSCRSGVVYGFTGVELTAPDGTRLRIAGTPAGQGEVYYFASGATVPVQLGPCGTFSMEQQNSRINHVNNVRGSAQLACTSKGTTVSGALTFENCH